MVRDINPGPAGSNPQGMININGTLYFAANDGTDGVALWKTNGTPGGTVMVKAIAPGSLTNVNGTPLFHGQ
jgi:ELWxxDGT repeat protein